MVLPLRMSSNSISTRAGGAPSATGGGPSAAALAQSARLTTRQNQLRIAAFYVDHTIAKLEPTVEEPAHRARIDHVLLLEDTRGEPGGVVVGEHRHRRQIGRASWR